MALTSTQRENFARKAREAAESTARSIEKIKQQISRADPRDLANPRHAASGLFSSLSSFQDRLGKQRAKLGFFEGTATRADAMREIASIGKEAQRRANVREARQKRFSETQEVFRKNTNILKRLATRQTLSATQKRLAARIIAQFESKTGRQNIKSDSKTGIAASLAVAKIKPKLKKEPKKVIHTVFVAPPAKGFEKRIEGVLQFQKDVEKTRKDILKGVSSVVDLRKKEGDNYLTGLLKAIGRLPIDIPAGIVSIGGNVAVAAEGAYRVAFKNDKQSARALSQAAKQTPIAIVRAYDPRQPEGLLNIVLTALMVKGLKNSRAATRQLNAELKTAIITRATIKTKTVGNKVIIEKIGTMQLGKSKRIIPFKERTVVKKSAIKKADFKTRTVQKFTVRPGSVKKVISKFEGTQLAGVKSTRVFIKGKVGRFKVEAASVADKTTARTAIALRGKLRLKTRRVVAETKLTTSGKKTLETTIAKAVKKSGLVQQLARRVNARLNALRKAGRPVDATTRKLVLKARRVSFGMRQTGSKLLRHKGGTGALTRGSGSGLGTGGSGALKSGIDRISALEKSAHNTIKAMEAKMKALRTKPQRITTKIREKSITKPKPKPKSKPVSDVFPDFTQVSLRQVLVPSVIPLLPSVPSVRAGFSNQLKAIARPSSEVPVISPATPKAGTEPKGLTETPPVPITGGEPVSRTGTQPIVGSPSAPKTTNPILKYVFTVPPIIGRLVGRGILPLSTRGFGGRNNLYFQIRQGIRESRVYRPDLYSVIYGKRANAKERANLLRIGRTFSGFETRKLV